MANRGSAHTLINALQYNVDERNHIIIETIVHGNYNTYIQVNMLAITEVQSHAHILTHNRIHSFHNVQSLDDNRGSAARSLWLNWDQSSSSFPFYTSGR